MDAPQNPPGTPEAQEGERPLRLVVGLCGGIAAYKAVFVIRELRELGHRVDVVPTRAALRFVGRPTLEAVSGAPVTDDVFDDVAEVRHVALGQRADAIVVAPATANTIARMAAGLADDLLGTTLLASRAPIVIAPAMHTEMWEHPATRANTALLAERGAVFVGPDSGRLTGSDSGRGRLAEPAEIVRAVLAAARSAPQAPVGDLEGPRDLAGLRLLVTAGGTREALDPVRFLGNRSSGRQGAALAARARARGAEVTLLAANLEDRPPEGVRVLETPDAAGMAAACARLAPSQDVIVMAAAVADYRPSEVSEGKLRKEELGEELVLRLARTPDILASLSAARAPGQTIVGFAAETEADERARLRLGRAKIARKGCDLLVVNRVGWHEGFSTPDNAVEILDRDGRLVRRHAGSKSSVAEAVLDAVLEHRREPRA